MPNMNIPNDLRRLYKDGRVLLFVGAGASMSVTWGDNGEKRGLSWSELVDQAAKILDVTEPELLRMRGTDLQILEYFLAKKGNFSPLINWLNCHMQPSDDALRCSKIHAAIAKLELCKTIYTTNYDDFLERSLELNGKKVTPIRSERDMGYDANDAVQVVKFHGDFSNPENMVLSEQHYESRLSMSTELDLKLRSDVLGRAILFVGYSFRDQNIAYLFRGVTDKFKELPDSFSGKRAYIIVSNPSDFEMQLFNNRKIEVIPAFGSNRTDSVAAVLEELSIK